MKRGLMAALLLLLIGGAAQAADPPGTSNDDIEVAAGAYAAAHGYHGIFPLNHLLARLDSGALKPDDIGPDRLFYCSAACGFLSVSRVGHDIIFVAPMTSPVYRGYRVIRVAVEPLPSHAYGESERLMHRFFRFVGWQKFRQSNGFDANLVVVREVE